MTWKKNRAAELQEAHKLDRVQEYSGAESFIVTLAVYVYTTEWNNILYSRGAVYYNKLTTAEHKINPRQYLVQIRKIYTANRQQDARL